MTDSAFESLLRDNPWPETDGVTAWDYTLGGYGRDMVDDIIRTKKPRFMLEIGCFLCSSAKRWLSLNPDLKLIGVDPWSDHLVEQVWRYVGRPKLTREYPDMEDQKRFASDVERQGPFPTALANLRGFEGRFVPCRGLSPDALYDLKDRGFAPELIYIDANKQAVDLEVCHELWPDAQITGDDWHWSRSKGFPMRDIVNAFANKHGFTVRAEHATWVLER